MSIPKDLLYTEDHEWVRKLDNGNVQVGITDHAQNSMGDIVFVELPEIEDSIGKGDTLCNVESVKAVSDVYCPVDGVVSNVNEALEDAPEMINQTPYEAWIVELSDVELGDLLSPEDYEALLVKGE